MSTLEQLQDEWNVWLEPTYVNNKGQVKKTIQQVWREANPGEYSQLLAYREGGPKPTLASSMGKQMVEHVEAWLTEKAEQPPEPPPEPIPPVATLIQTIAQGNVLSGMANWIAIYDADADNQPDDPGSVQFLVDDEVLRTEQDQPFGDPPWLDTNTLGNGQHAFQVKAFNSAGTLVAASNRGTATVDNVAIPPPPSEVKPLFSGRASRMNSITGSTVKIGDAAWQGGSNASQDPHIWGYNPTHIADGVMVMTDSCKVVSDPKFGKVFLYEIGPGDTNPYFNQPTKPNGELTFQRPLAQNQVDWYTDVFKIISPYTMMSFNVIDQFGYPSLASPPLSISFDSKGIGIDRHVGILIKKSDLSGPDTFIEKPRFYSIAQVIDKWVEYVIGVKWNVNSTGWIEVYVRLEGETTFTKKFEHRDTPTWQQVQGDSIKTSGNDKMGLYFGTASPPPTNKVKHRGYERFATKEEAFAPMG